MPRSLDLRLCLCLSASDGDQAFLGVGTSFLRASSEIGLLEASTPFSPPSPSRAANDQRRQVSADLGATLNQHRRETSLAFCTTQPRKLSATNMAQFLQIESMEPTT